MNEITPDVGVLNLAVVKPGIYRGAQPTDAGWAWLRDAGVKTVIKLNSEDESSDVAAEALGMTVIYKPISLVDQLVFRPNDADVQACVEAMKPGTFVHCEHGQDRTGLVVGCFRVWEEAWTKDVAYAEMLQHGFHPELLGLTLYWEWAV